jgi:hypothetical protein
MVGNGALNYLLPVCCERHSQIDTHPQLGVFERSGHAVTVVRIIDEGGHDCNYKMPDTWYRKNRLDSAGDAGQKTPTEAVKQMAARRDRRAGCA